MKMKRQFKQWLYTRFPGSQVNVESFFATRPLLRRVLRVGFAPTFTGWGMSTVSHTPWGRTTISSNIETGVNKCYQTLLDLIARKTFNLTQFKGENIPKVLDGLMWRHYLVYWSAYYAASNTKVNVKNLVECGVCDGLTSYFAMNALTDSTCEWNAFLYDGWDAMREDLLLDKEKKNEGMYDYLSVESTKKNLSMFGNHVRFNKGYIPESFVGAENPEEIVWMHIDLNSATPTIAALDFFWDKMATGGVVLLDDYGWPGYEDTRDMVIAWADGKKGQILPLPTGQAMIFKQ